MSLRAFLLSIVGVLLLGAATVYGAIALEGSLGPLPGVDRPPDGMVDVLVATQDIPACTPSDEWAGSMELVWRPLNELPDGALRDTSVLADEVIAVDVEDGEVIKAQFFGRMRDCVTPAG